jgi:hypothetical protein
MLRPSLLLLICTLGLIFSSCAAPQSEVNGVDTNEDMRMREDQRAPTGW